MKYEVKHIKEECCFVCFQDQCLALLKYQMLDRELMNIYHIEVMDIKDSQNIEMILMKEVLEYARKNHYRVLTTSAWVRNYLVNHPNCQNMLL